MRGRKYIVVIIFAWLAILALGGVLAFDTTRMDQAEQAHVASMVARGAELFANNCIMCHGIAGQGHVGPPLNTAGLQGDPLSDGDLYDMLYRTIAYGRPGTTTPKWQRLPNEQWASFTAMPTFSEETGGPFNEMHLRALVYFIMSGEWGMVGRYAPAPNLLPDEHNRPNREAVLARMPSGVDIEAGVARRGQEIFYDRACITCHALGGVGGYVGPDLSRVGSWAVGISDEAWREWLRGWIDNPQAVADRAPVYWSNYAGPLLLPTPVHAQAPEAPPEAGAVPGSEGTDAGLEAGRQIPGVAPGLDFGIEIPDPQPLPPSQMPRLGLSDEELDILTQYLLSLK